MPDQPATTRRSLLRAGASAVAGLAGATAGCLELMPPLGQRIRYGRVDVPDGDPPAYRRWLPAPSAIEDDHYLHPGTVWVATPAVDGSEVFGRDLGLGRAFAAGMTDYVGYAYDDYDLVVGVGSAVAVEGPIDPEVAAQTLRIGGYEPAGEYGGYALFEREGPARTTAVADGRFVHSDVPQHRRDVEAVIDARAGDLPRFHEDDAAFDRVVRAAGTRPFLLGGADNFLIRNLDPVAGLSGIDFDADSVYSLVYMVFPEGETPARSRIRRELGNFEDAVAAVSVDLQVDGRLAVVEAEMDADAAFDDGGAGEEPPLATWGVDVGPDEVVLRHEAGQSVPASQLEAGSGRDWTFERQFADEYDVVAPGAELSVDREDVAGVVLLTWTAPEDQSSSTLLRHELP